MSRWVCPDCGREFGNARQAHVCEPGVSLAEVFAGRPPVQREVYDALLAYLNSLGPVHADAVRVGVFLKSDRKLAEIRPMARALSVEIVLPRPVDAPRITRRLRTSADTIVHVVRLTATDEVDDELLGWLTEAYDYATG